jgi:hypothetical protein
MFSANNSRILHHILVICYCMAVDPYTVPQIAVTFCSVINTQLTVYALQLLQRSWHVAAKLFTLNFSVYLYMYQSDQQHK